MIESKCSFYEKTIHESSTKPNVDKFDILPNHGICLLKETKSFQCSIAKCLQLGCWSYQVFLQSWTCFLESKDPISLVEWTFPAYTTSFEATTMPPLELGYKHVRKHIKRLSHDGWILLGIGKDNIYLWFKYIYDEVNFEKEYNFW